MTLKMITTSSNVSGAAEKVVLGDDEPEYEDSGNTALQGEAPSEVGQGELGALLLELTGATAKAAVLVAELNESEYKAVQGRLNTFLDLARQIESMRPKADKIVGFKREVRRSAKRSKRRTKASNR